MHACTHACPHEHMDAYAYTYGHTHKHTHHDTHTHKLGRFYFERYDVLSSPTFVHFDISLQLFFSPEAVFLYIVLKGEYWKIFVVEISLKLLVQEESISRSTISFQKLFNFRTEQTIPLS